MTILEAIKESKTGCIAFIFPMVEAVLTGLAMTKITHTQAKNIYTDGSEYYIKRTQINLQKDVDDVSAFDFASVDKIT